MKMMIAIAIAALGGYYFYNHIMPTNDTWLHGEWRNIDADPGKTDIMAFHSNGTVDLRNDRGTYITCVYLTLNSKISMECRVKGETKELNYRISEDQRQLTSVEFDSRFVLNN